MHKALIPSGEVDDFIIVRATAFVSRIQRAVVRDVLRDEKLPVLEWRLLFSVARFGSCHLAHITQRTSIDPAHGSRAASALEAKGLITRTDDPANRRRKVISLTPRGVETFERIWPRVRGIVRSVTGAMDPEDFRETKRLMDLLNLAAEPLQEPQSAERTTDTTERKEPPLAAE